MLKKYIFTILILVLNLPLSAQQINIRLQGTAAIPTDDFEEVVEVGYGGNINISTEFLYPNVRLGITSGYYYCGLKEDLPDYDFSFRTIPLLAGFRIYLDDYNFIPYVGLEGGLYFNEYWIEIDYGVFGLYSTTTQETTFGIAPEIGFKMNLSPNIDLDVNAKYNILNSIYIGRSFLFFQSGFSFNF